MNIKHGLILISIFLIATEASKSQHRVINNPESGLWQDYKYNPIKFELIGNFGDKYSDTLKDNKINFYRSNSIVNVGTDSNLNVYVLDSQASLIAKFNSDGELLWQVNQRGRGPGSLENVLSMAINDKVYITNLLGTRLDVFNLEGKFEKSLNLSSAKKGSQYIVGIISNRYLVLKSEIQGEIGANIVVFDITKSFRLLSDFNVYVDHSLKIPSNERILSPASIVGDLIAVSQDVKYGIKYYDIRGNLMKEINRDFPRYVRPGIHNIGKRGIMISLGGIYSQFLINNEFLINFINWPTELKNPDEVAEKIIKGSFPNLEHTNSLDIYTKEGELLYSIEGEGIAPEIGWLMHSDSLSNIYTRVALPFPHVRKYKMAIKK